MNSKEHIRKVAEAKVEPLCQVLRRILEEAYVSGYLTRIDEETAQHAVNDEPAVRLKPDAVLRRILTPEDFSKRTYRILKEKNIRTLGDIIKHTAGEMMMFEGFGHKCLYEVMGFVHSYGYTIKTEMTDGKDKE